MNNPPPRNWSFTRSNQSLSAPRKPSFTGNRLRQFMSTLTLTLGAELTALRRAMERIPHRR
jgi:hypothetical protein